MTDIKSAEEYYNGMLTVNGVYTKEEIKNTIREAQRDAIRLAAKQTEPESIKAPQSYYHSNKILSLLKQIK